MSLLQKASIITTPTAYAEDYLYSIKPAKVTVNSITSFANGTSFALTTFTSTANNVTSGIVSSAFGGCVSNAITLKKNQKVKVTFDYTQNSGNELRVLFSKVVTGAGTTISDSTTINATGTFTHTFTITEDATGYLQLGTGNSGHSINFSALNVRAEVLSLADFDFDRNSTGTRVNEDYLIEDVPYNLVLHSQSFSSGWFNTNSTETLDTSVLAPDGTSTAWKLQANAGTHFSFLGQTVTMSGQISFSVFLKKGTATTASVFLSESGNFGLTANLENGTITSVTGSDMVGSVESAGNGWYRFEIKHTSGDDLSNSVRIGVEGGSFGSVTYDGTENIYIWGAQITKGGIKPYLKTTDRLDIPRIDYTNGEPSILLEPSRTNNVTKSNSDFTANNTTITYNNINSPEGIQNAFKVECTSSGTSVYARTASIAFTDPVTFSVFVKYGNAQYLQFLDSVSGNHFLNFDVEKGVIGTSGSDTIGTFVEYPNGWYRVSATFSGLASSSTFRVYISNSNSAGYASGTATVGDFYYAYGWQVENGSYPTSLIHTSGSAVTRSADAANNAGNSDLFNDSEGVLYTEIKGLADDSTFRMLSISDGSINNRVNLLFSNTSNTIRAVVNVSLASQADLNSTNYDITEFHKVAFKYKANDFSLYIDGKEVATDTSGNVFSANTLSKLSFVRGDNNNNFYGNCKMVAVFKEALTDLELEKLTGYNNHELYMNYYNRLSYLGLVEEYNVESDINNYIL